MCKRGDVGSVCEVGYIFVVVRGKQTHISRVPDIMATICMTQLELDTGPSGVQPTPQRALESTGPVNGGDDPPATAANALEKWNYPRHNIPRLIATFWSFIVSGANDAAYGVCHSCRYMVRNHADRCRL